MKLLTILGALALCLALTGCCWGSYKGPARTEEDYVGDANLELERLVKVYKIFTAVHGRNPKNAAELATQFGNGYIASDPWSGEWRVSGSVQVKREKAERIVNGQPRGVRSWTENVGKAEVRSAGPDGVYNTDDDVVWTGAKPAKVKASPKAN